VRDQSSKSLTINLKVVEAKYSDVFGDMARLHLDHRPFAKAGRVVVLVCNSKKTRVVARGALANDRGSIALDSATRVRLGVNLNQSVAFEISKAGFIDEVMWAWDASDAMPRVAARLGAVSVCLGFVGLVLGIISLCQ